MFPNRIAMLTKFNNILIDITVPITAGFLPFSLKAEGHSQYYWCHPSGNLYASLISGFPYREVLYIFPPHVLCYKEVTFPTLPSTFCLCTVLSPLLSLSRLLLSSVIGEKNCFPSETNQKISLSICSCHSIYLLQLLGK